MTYLGEAGEEGRVDNVKKGVLRDETAQAEKKKLQGGNLTLF